MASTTDGLNWMHHAPICTNDLFAAAPGFVVCGSAGAILTSNDGREWIRRATPTEHTLSSLAFGNGTHVAAGSGGAVLYSTNLVDWELAEPFTERWILGLAYGNGTFVAVSSFGHFYTSPDGKVWTEQSVLTSKAWLRGVAFGNGAFVAVDDTGTAHRSVDGIEWLSFATGSSSTLTSVSTIPIIGKTEFLVTALEGHTFVSPDGMEWRPWGTVANAVLWGSGAGVRGFAVVAGRNGAVAVARNLPGWLQVFPGAVLPPGHVYDFAVGNGVMIAAHYRGISFSQNLREWDFVGYQFVSSVAYGNGRFVATYGGGKIMTSPDGREWTDRANYSPVNFTKVRYANGHFVAVGSSSICISRNGLSWERKTIPASYLNSIAYGSGLWVAGSDDGIWISSDLEGWEFVPIDFNPYVFSVSYGNGVFVAAGQTGSDFLASTIYSSTDGRNWIGRLNVGRFHTTSFSNGQFLAAGDYGVVWWSKDGSEWTVDSHLFPNGITASILHDEVAFLGLDSSIVSADIGAALSDDEMQITRFPHLDTIGVRAKTRFGRTYQLQQSNDLRTWSNFRAQFPGDGSSDYQFISTADAAPRYYRYAIGD